MDPEQKPTFPADKDLGPTDRSLTTFITAEKTGNQAKQIVQGIRQQYGGPCDIVLIAMPAGKGRTFMQGMGEAMEQTGTLVRRIGNV